MDLILSQIGVLHKNQNPQEEQKKLKVGQLLVDTHGNMWRWDGFISHDNLQKKKIIDSELKINRLESENKSLEKKLDLLTRNSSVLKQSTESLENTVINENKKLEFIYKNFDLVISKLSKQKEKITITNYNIQKNF